jgi:hypothetical protein
MFNHWNQPGFYLVAQGWREWFEDADCAQLLRSRSAAVQGSESMFHSSIDLL